MRAEIVAEAFHERMPFERALNDGSLDADSPAMHQPDLPQPGRMRLVDVLVDHRWDVARLEGMQVEFWLDRDPNRFVQVPAPNRPAEPASTEPSPGLYRTLSFSYTAVTDVEMPPRTEKSPVTVIRFGRQAPTRSSRI